jgi:hypothetical protein
LQLFFPTLPDGSVGGLTIQVSDLIKRGKLKIFRKFWLPLLSRRAVLSYQPEAGGRPVKKKV